MPKRITRDDVARYAGVSTAVVSYALNNGPKRVAPATQTRVLDAVRVLGYQPNASARALKRGSSEMLGLMVPDSRNTFFAELAHAVEDAANASRRALVIVNVQDHEDDAPRKVLDLASRQVDGILIASRLTPPEAAAVASTGVRTVLINQFVPVEGFPSIGAEFFEGAKIGTQHLIELGHRRIGFIGGAPTIDQREAGWADALIEAGLRRGPRLRAKFSHEGGYGAARELLAGNNRPSAIFVSSDLQANGVLRACHEAGLEIPGDISIVSFDGSPIADYCWPPLTTVEQPIRQMAADAVAELLGEAPLGTSFRRYPTNLRIGRSSGPAATRPVRN